MPESSTKPLSSDHIAVHFTRKQRTCEDYLAAEESSCIHINSQSLRLKLRCKAWEVKSMETWARPGICDVELRIQGMDITRVDQRGSVGGGRALYVSSKLKANRLMKTNFQKGVGQPYDVHCWSDLRILQTHQVQNIQMLALPKHADTLSYQLLLIAGSFNIFGVRLHILACFAGSESTSGILQHGDQNKLARRCEAARTMQGPLSVATGLGP